MLFIIPARKGSKGLPAKNKKLLNGKPLFEYTLDAALCVTSPKNIVVSTDDEDILEASIEKGCIDIGLRPECLATDTARAIDTYKYVISKINHLDFNDICILQPTSPLRTSYDINSAIELYYENCCDSVVSYCEEHHPIYWHKFLDNNGRFLDIFPENIKNRQESRKTFYPNGSIFIFKKTLLMENKYYSENSMAYIMPRERSIDIDYQIDFDYAEFLLKRDQKI